MANDVVIDIVANDKTKRAFGSVKAGMLGIGKVALGTVTKVAKIGAAFAAAATASAIALTKMSMSAVDNLSKTADKIGITTEALSGLHHAAELSGVSTETMNMALQRMTRRVSEAANGTGEAVGALKELGINAYELERLPLDEQMNVVADAMQNVESQSDRVRLSMKLFDSEGVALVNTLKGGSESLEQFAREAEQLGLVVSEVDAKQIEAANDAVTKAKGVFTGLGNQLATAFAPIIEHVANMFRQGAIDSTEFGNVGQRVADAVVNSYAAVQDTFKRIQILLKKMQIGVKDFGMFWTMALSKITFGDIRAGLEAAAVDMFNDVENMKVELDQLLSEPLPSDQIRETYEEIRKQSRQTAEQIVSDNEEIKGSNVSVGETLNQWQRQFITSQQEGQKKADEFNQATTVGRTKLVLEEGSKQLAAFKGQSKKMFAVQKAAAIATAIINTAESVTKTMSAYPFPIDIALSALSLAAGMAQVSAIRSQSYLGGGFTGYGARAGGVDGKGGMHAIVHPNETIIDHERGGGAGVQQTINIQTGVAQTVRAEIQNLLPEIVEISKAAIIDSNQRGGSFRNGLLGA